MKNPFARLVATKPYIPPYFELSYLTHPTHADWSQAFFSAVSDRFVGVTSHDPNGTVLAAGYLNRHAVLSTSVEGWIEIAFRDGFKFATVEDSFRTAQWQAGLEALPATSIVHPNANSFFNRTTEIHRSLAAEGTKQEDIWKRFNEFHANVQHYRNKFYSQ